MFKSLILHIKNLTIEKSVKQEEPVVSEDKLIIEVRNYKLYN